MDGLFIGILTGVIVTLIVIKYLKMRKDSQTSGAGGGGGGSTEDVLPPPRQQNKK